MQRKVIGAAEVIKRMCPAPLFWCAFVTLTYRPGVRWKRRHISEALTCWRKELAIADGSKLRYVWVLELTVAGVPHYHVAIWLPVGTMLSKPDESGAWPHGMSRIERARQPVGYMVKYVSKGTDCDKIPRGARLCGAGGLEVDGRAEVRWKMLPAYLRHRCSVGDHVVRFKGVCGGWVSLTTGEWWASPVAQLVDGKLTWTHPPPES